MATTRQQVAQLGKSLLAAAPSIAPAAAVTILGRLVDTGIDGYSKLPGAKKSAAAALQKSGSAEAAIDALVRQHLAMAGAQGFVTNLGGFETIAVALPANVSAMAIVQTHLVAAIAHLRGYDIDDARVRAAIALCLLGEKEVTAAVAAGDLPAPLVVATAPVIDQTLHAQISEKVLTHVVGNATGKKITVLASKKIPVVGGVVGAGTDGYGTWAVAQYARKAFVNRRR